MSRYAENLGRAARMLKRLDDIGGPSELEGVPLKEIIDDVLTAQNHAFMDEAIGRIRVERGLSERIGAATPARTVSEVGAPAQEHGVAEVPVAVRSESDTHLVEPDNVVDLHSRKVFACNPDESGGLL